MSSLTASTKLARIAEQSKQNPAMVFITLAHQMDEGFLTEAFYQLRKDAAPGIDQMTVTEYEVNLGERITDLHRRLVNGQYRAQPARRVWIPKGDGGQRPLAILVLEDKIVQRAVAMILEAIYEPYFYDFSFGFRRHFSAHGAVIYLRQQCLKLGINWIIDADIRKFFDTISWEQLRTILQKRMNDGAILRLIGMWLHVGVMEEGQVVNQEVGTPQGAPVSPILANIFLHVVLDEWFQNEVRPRMGGNCFLARYADDFVMGFSLKGDAERVFKVLPKRFERFGLSIHPEKSRMVQFSRPYWKCGKGPGSFAFLGFTHYWAKTLKGGWTIKRKTQGKRLCRFLSGIGDWCKENRHEPVAEQHKTLSTKLRGHYEYYGVRGNFKMLEVAYEHTRMMWKKWLRRRNSKDRMGWDKFAQRVEQAFVLPLPRIIHVF
ncbi:MAG: group II intron reverse transcriptase/maturase [Acidobacteria bacterium]|nr:MAG: group II intron reverse transcriptase/maturase [Acidobacteriota bacterium]